MLTKIEIRQLVSRTLETTTSKTLRTRLKKFYEVAKASGTIYLLELIKAAFQTEDIDKEADNYRKFRAASQKLFKQQGFEIVEPSSQKQDIRERYLYIQKVSDSKTPKKAKNAKYMTNKTLEFLQTISSTKNDDSYKFELFVESQAFKTNVEDVGKPIIRIFCSLAERNQEIAGDFLLDLDSQLYNLQQSKRLIFEVFVYKLSLSETKCRFIQLEPGANFQQELILKQSISDISLLLCTPEVVASKTISEQEIPVGLAYTAFLPVALSPLPLPSQLFGNLQILFYHQAPPPSKSYSQLNVEEKSSFVEKIAQNILDKSHRLLRHRCLSQQLMEEHTLEKKLILQDKTQAIARYFPTQLTPLEYFIQIEKNPEQEVDIKKKDQTKNNAPRDAMDEMTKKVLQKREENYEKKNWIDSQTQTILSMKKQDSSSQEDSSPQIESGLTHLLRWVDAPITESHPITSVLGEFGTGKTFLVRMLTHKLLNSPQRKFTPLYIDLRDINLQPSQAITLEYILGELLRIYGFPKQDPDSLIEEIYSGFYLVIFDGLDEITMRLPRDQISHLLQEMLRVFPAQTANKASPRINTKVIFTCRSHYFRDIQDQIRFFSNNYRGRIDLSQKSFISMLPFSEEEIEKFIHKRIPRDANRQRVLETIHSVYNIKDLVKRPFLLNQFCANFSSIDDKLIQGKQIVSTDIYKTIEEEWIGRDQDKSKLEAELKSRLMCDLSMHLWSKQANSLKATELSRWINIWMHQNPVDRKALDIDTEILQEDLRTASFVVRSASEDDFRFAHTSMQEYFLAKWFVGKMLDWEDEHAELFGINNFSEEAWVFIGELLQSLGEEDKKAIENAMQQALSKPQSQELRDIFLRLWQLLEDKGILVNLHLQGLNLSGADLSNRVFERLNFAGADCREASFFKTSFKNCNLNGANFAASNLAHARLQSCSCLSANFQQAECQSLESYNCHFSQADWQETKLGNTSFFACSGLAADWLEEHKQLIHHAELPLNSQAASLPESRLKSIGLEQPWHFDTVHSLAFSPCGQFLVSASYDKSIKLFDAKTQKCLHRFLDHSDVVLSVAFSPCGSLLASGSYDKSIKLFDVQSRSCIHTFSDHSGWVFSVAFSPCGQFLASGSWDESIKLFDVKSRTCIHTFSEHSNSVDSLAFSPCGQFLASGSSDNSIKLFDVASRSCLHSFSEHSLPVSSVAFSSCGSFLASGSSDNSIKLFDVKSRSCIHTFSEHSDSVYSLAFSPCGQFLASGSSDNSIKLFDVKSRTCIHTFSKHSDSVDSLAFSPCGQFLASGSGDKSIKLFDVKSRTCIHTFSKHSDSVDSLAFSPCGQFLASGSDDNSIKLFDVKSRSCIHTFSDHSGWVFSVAFSPCGQFLASGSWDESIKLFDVKSRTCIHTFSEHSRSVDSLAFSPCGQFLASGSSDNSIKLFDVQSRTCIHTFSEHSRSVNSLAFSPCGQFLASGSRDEFIKLFDVQSRTCIHTFSEHSGSVDSLAFSPCGQFLASGSGDEFIKLFDVQSRTCIHSFSEHSGSVCSLAFSPCGQFLASGSEDEFIKLFDVQSRTCIHTFSEHSDSVYSLAFSPCGQFLASGSGDSTTRIFCLKSKKQITHFEQRAADIHFAADLEAQKITHWQNMHLLPQSLRPFGLDAEARARPLECFQPELLETWQDKA